MRTHAGWLERGWVMIAAVTGAMTVASHAWAQSCELPMEPTFSVHLPKLNLPPNEDGLNWDLPPVWGSQSGVVDETIEIPNGRPIYALIVSGYTNNAHLDQLMVYDFARHLMAQGAYVHYAWWNNLLAPYMERPLHSSQSHPGTASDLANFITPQTAANKALPGDDYQFIADAKLLLSAIRANNPEAVIVLVGHSMGGQSVIRLASQSDVLIDLLAPIDPVANRTYPWAGAAFFNAEDYNWTRYRATRQTFLGYRAQERVFTQGCLPLGCCVAVGPWRKTRDEALAASSGGCGVLVHGAPAMNFGNNVINVYHRWQHEAAFPFDYQDARLFHPSVPPGGSQTQLAVTTKASGPDPGGWPGTSVCPCNPGSGGVAWDSEGHGEIIGARGPTPPRPLGFRVRTSPECGALCPTDSWPARTVTQGVWSNGQAAQRRQLMQALDGLPAHQTWTHAPFNPDLCLVSQPLIDRFGTMNKPPIANAGGDVYIVCDGCDVLNVALDGAASFDPDGDPLQFTWTFNNQVANGPLVDFDFPRGTHCVRLVVTDPSGHVSLDFISVTLQDTTSVVSPFTSATAQWKSAATFHEAIAFDEQYPGIVNGGGCLLANPDAPGVVHMNGGTVTITAQSGSATYCAIQDSATAPAVSDARINDNAVVLFEFDPPITAFYTFYGSLAAGDTVTMKLLGERGELVDTITSPPSSHSTLAAGQGFTSTQPIQHIEFTSSEAGSVMVGAFVGLRPGEPSLGTVDLGSYGGPAGTGEIHLDFAVTFVGILGDLNGDGAVNVSDLLILLNAWGPCAGCAADLNHDGFVNVSDLLNLLANWG